MPVGWFTVEPKTRQRMTSLSLHTSYAFLVVVVVVVAVAASQTDTVLIRLAHCCTVDAFTLFINAL